MNKFLKIYSRQYQKTKILFLTVLVAFVFFLAGSKEAYGASIVCSALSVYNGTTNDASSVIQSCIDNSSSGDTVNLPPGIYYVSTGINIGSHPITLETSGKNSSMTKCAIDDSSCAEIIASSNSSNLQGNPVLNIAEDNTTIDHIIVSGNKRQRTQYPYVCTTGNNHGGNVLLGGSYVSFTNGVSEESHCGSALGTCTSNTTNVTVSNNTIANNGVHNINGGWSDGVTAGDCLNSTFTNNQFIDNTDVDFIFGGCQGCTVQNNTLTHTSSFEGSSFASLMLYNWPGWPSSGTSGNYTSSVFSNNSVDCGPEKRCGFGLYLGGDSWSSFAKPYGGSVHDNTITNAQQGVNVDDIHDFELYNNSVANSGGNPIVTNEGTMPGTAYNMSTDSYNVDISGDNGQVTYTTYNWDGQVPNQEDVVINDAVFVSQSVPATMVAGNSYPVSVTFRNTGTTSWTNSSPYDLGSQNPEDNMTWDIGRVYLNNGETIGPGQTKTFSFNAKAPATAGTYNFQWQVLQENVAWFGQKTTNVPIAVTASGSIAPASPTGLTVR